MLIEGLLVGLAVGFIFGYFNDKWALTKKIADWLDKFFNKVK